jgi:O-antigen chain-terminating methyltransferase
MVDVGCGRGEWLGLLQQQGFHVTGIDLNPDMVSYCTALGLQAQCMDAVAYLRGQPENSLALVTGFHIIEHLPFEILLNLLDAALRALRPDGLVIFETPNPENLIVGACNFYYDPTHRHPIVPVVAQFMAQQRGFAKAEILRLHPYPQDHLLAEDSEIAKRVNQAFYGPQDYAVVAWKTHAI